MLKLQDPKIGYNYCQITFPWWWCWSFNVYKMELLEPSSLMLLPRISMCDSPMLFYAILHPEWRAPIYFNYVPILAGCKKTKSRYEYVSHDGEGTHSSVYIPAANCESFTMLSLLQHCLSIHLPVTVTNNAPVKHLTTPNIRSTWVASWFIRVSFPLHTCNTASNAKTLLTMLQAKILAWRSSKQGLQIYAWSTFLHLDE
jgi:hypothetical protein